MTNASNPVIEVKALTKRYRGTQHDALHELNISVTAGEVYGFLGPNGAGKSTAIRLLMNFIMPTSGDMTILGQSVVKQSPDIHAEVGYLSGDFVAYPKMTGQEFLDYMSVLSPPKSQKYLRQLASQLDIDLRKVIGSLSKGNRQKIGIIQAFMSDPKVLILDEPTSGLDPLKQEVFYDLVKDSSNRGACVFVSSHNLGEVQKMCNRVGIIRDGILVHESKISDLEFEASQNFEIRFKNKPPASQLRKLKELKSLKISGNTATLHMHGDLGPLLKVLSESDVSRIETGELNLEDEFMRFYEKAGKK